MFTCSCAIQNIHPNTCIYMTLYDCARRASIQRIPLPIVSVSDKRVHLVKSINCGYGYKISIRLRNNNFLLFAKIDSKSLVECSLKAKLSYHYYILRYAIESSSRKYAILLYRVRRNLRVYGRSIRRAGDFSFLL